MQPRKYRRNRPWACSYSIRMPTQDDSLGPEIAAGYKMADEVRAACDQVARETVAAAIGVSRDILMARRYLELLANQRPEPNTNMDEAPKNASILITEGADWHEAWWAVAGESWHNAEGTFAPIAWLPMPPLFSE